MKKNPLKKIKMLPLGMAASFLISLAGCSNNNSNSKDILKDYAITSIEETSEYYLVRINGHIYLTTRETKSMDYAKDYAREVYAYYDVKSGDLVGVTLDPTWTRNAIEEFENAGYEDYENYNEIESWTTHDNSTRDYEIFEGIYGYGNIIPATSIYNLTDFLTQTKMSVEDLVFFTSDSDRLKEYIEANIDFGINHIATSATFDIERLDILFSKYQILTNEEHYEEAHWLIKFTCIKGDTQEVIVGYRVSESEKDIGYNIVYDVITGNLINISLTNANGYDEIIEEELLGTAYTIEYLKNLVPEKAPELDENENQDMTEDQKEIGEDKDEQKEEPTEDWLKDESHPTYPNLYEVDFDAMLQQKFEISDDILNNDDVQKVISEIKDYFGDTPLYAYVSDSSTDSETRINFYLLDNKNGDQDLYINYDADFSSLFITYNRFDDPIYSRSLITHYYSFNEDGTTRYRNYTKTQYVDSNRARYTIAVDDGYGYVSYQTISFNEPDALFSICLKNAKKIAIETGEGMGILTISPEQLVIGTAEGENIISLSPEQYTMLREKMDKYSREGNLFGFVKDSKDILKQLVRSIGDEYTDEQIDYIDALIDMYSEMEHSKQLKLQ